MDSDIVSDTKKHFHCINFEDLNERCIDAIIASEFTDNTDYNISYGGLITTDDPIKTLKRIGHVCDSWANIQYFDNDESNANNTSMWQDECLWTTLDNMGITVSDFQAFIYLICCKAVKSSSTVEDKRAGLLTATIYFKCMKTRGCNTFSVYNPNLFRKCIECLQLPDVVERRDSLYKWKDFESLFEQIATFLRSLLPLLGSFHLGSDRTTVEFVIEKLAEMVAAEISKKRVDFDIDFLNMSKKESKRNHSDSTIVASLAFQGLTILMDNDLNGEKDDIYETILTHLNDHILCKRVKNAQHQSITMKYLNIRDNVDAYIRRNLSDRNELVSQLTLISLKRLCLLVCDRAEFRNVVSESILCIMFCLRIEDLVDLLQYLLLLVDAVDVHHRIFALEMLGKLLEKSPFNVNTEGLPEELEVYLTPIPMIFAVFTRCDDISPVVRTKALSTISQNMKVALRSLTERDEPEVFSADMNTGKECYNHNGVHRSFWYKFGSFPEMLEEIAAIFHRRIEDCNGMARKAALQALENVITFDEEYLSRSNLKLFTMASKDSIIVMRKQTVQSLTAILERYPCNPLSQEYWLRCILPLVRDPEDSVQKSVLAVIEDKFLVAVMTGSDAQRDASFALMRKMADGEIRAFRWYLQKTFGLWKKDGKLSPQKAGQLEKSLCRGNDDMIWQYLAIFASYSKIPLRMCNLAVEEVEKPVIWKDLNHIKNVLRVISQVYSSLDNNVLEGIRSNLRGKIESYAFDVEILEGMVEVLNKIEKHLDNEAEFSQFAIKMIQSSVDILSPFVARLGRTDGIVSSEESAIKCLGVIKEFCSIFPNNVTPRLCVLLKGFVVRSKSNTLENISGILQAHAFVALGKISLQDEALAMELMPLMAQKVLHKKEDLIYNNCVIVLVELCKRYTSYADQYIPIMCPSFKNNRFLIRRQSLALVLGLLQEDYIKCRGPLLFCILSTIIDQREEMQELGKFSLLQLLHAKNSSIFANHFAESLFVFNHFRPPENNETNSLAKTVKNLECFALRYKENDNQRMQIYKFMLNNTSVLDKIILVKSLCEEILACVANYVFPLNKATGCMIHDCFSILSSVEIRAFDSAKVREEYEDDDAEERVSSEANVRLLTLIRPVIPVCEQLSTVLWSEMSDLYPELAAFLSDILRDFKDQLPELIQDKNLLKQVLFEMNHEKLENRNQTKNNQSVVPVLEILEPQLAEEDVEMEVPTSKTPKRKSTTVANSNGPTTNGASCSVDLMDIPSSSRDMLHPYMDDKLLCSTPRVVLQQLSTMDLPNISGIAMEVDSD